MFLAEGLASNKNGPDFLKQRREGVKVNGGEMVVGLRALHHRFLTGHVRCGLGMRGDLKLRKKQWALRKAQEDHTTPPPPSLGYFHPGEG